MLKFKLTKPKRLYPVCTTCDRRIPYSVPIIIKFGLPFCCKKCLMIYHNKLVDEGKSLMEKYTDEELASVETAKFRPPSFHDNYKEGRKR